MITTLPPRDSYEIAGEIKRRLAMERSLAAQLGDSAVAAIRSGVYTGPDGTGVSWKELVSAAVARKVSIPPDAPLPEPQAPAGAAQATTVQVMNETTLGAARALAEQGLRPLALNFANGIYPGGGFRSGARAQEENLCRSSALFATLEGDPMYSSHKKRRQPDSSDWTILSPDVPVFRTDDGTALAEPWLLSFITCAAPVAAHIGLERSSALLHTRIHRVLAIARAYGYVDLVLGAWGCGAFGNDPKRTARSFREALEGPFAGAFRHVVFAISDWSAGRRMLGPFRDQFA